MRIRSLFVFLLLIDFTSCSSKKEETVIKQTENSLDSLIEVKKKDSVFSIKEESELMVENPEPTDSADFRLVIYEGGSFVSMSVNPNLGFDLLPFIEDKYMQGMVNSENAHTLKPEKRKLFFEAAKMKVTDTLFCFDLELDTVCKYLLNVLPLNAFLSPYEEPYNDERSYFVGFELPKPCGKYGGFASVGGSNPFVTESFKPMIWKRVDRSEFPKIDYKYDTIKVYGKHVKEPHESLLHESNGLKYT